MIRRLLLILIAATQIAALPLSVSPPIAEVGTPLTISITLPEETTKLAGFPDLEPFALLGLPERTGKTLTLHLLPLRPGQHAIPALTFQTGQRRDSTVATLLVIEAPAALDTPHPLRPLPESEQPGRPSWLWIPLTSGLVVLAFFLIGLLPKRLSKTLKPKRNNNDPFSELATSVGKTRIINDPNWDRFCHRLDRIRFSPLPHDPNELQELIKEFDLLRGETP